MLVALKPHNLYIGLDEDAYEQVYHLAKNLSGGSIRLFRAKPPEGKDFGDFRQTYAN